MTRAMILHAAVIEDIRANLRAPLDLLLRCLDSLTLCHTLVEQVLIEFRAEDTHSILLIHKL